MASRKGTSLAIACMAGIGIAVAGMAGAAPKTKADEQFKTVHGTAQPTRDGFVKEEEGMDSMDVRKAVQGKDSRDKY